METDKRIIEGFQKLSADEQTEYLSYLARVIVIAKDRKEKQRFRRFKAKLEKRVKFEPALT